MATLVLTTVGGLLAGRIGSAVGALLGQRVDQALLGPRRRGPRLGDLTVQTSSYGTPLPRLFGRMRAAGTVIWSTDLREERTRSGGKGRPKTTSYSYSASFAVALSARPLRAVGRIWADGNLLRGAAGDFKTDVGGFRLHSGSEDQAPDPLIVSAEGAASAPAYRGLAYVVFENFQLAEYGNRIPSLSFEVEADPGPVTISAIAAALSDGAIAGAATRTLAGYAAFGDSIAGAMETLAEVAALSLRDDGERLTLAPASTIVATLAPDELGASPAEPAPYRSDTRARPGAGEVAIAYYEPARDYQAGLQRARRTGGERSSTRIELPAAVSADDAKAMAEARLARLWTERTRRAAALPFARARLRPGELVAFADEPGAWRIAATTLERMVVEFDLVRHSAGVASATTAEPGRPVQQPDRAHGPTTLAVFELPDLSDDASGRLQIHVAAAGVSPGWRRAALSLSLDGGASWREAGETAAPAVLGTIALAPITGPAGVFDERGSIEVLLLNDAMTLAEADDARLVDGVNLALVGDELIQFGGAVPLGGNRWRLSRLLRGRRGTEHAIAGHVVGERFVLIERDSLAVIDAPASALGQSVRVMATGIGDVTAALAQTPIMGVSVRPPAPVALNAEPLGGGLSVTWTRRSRAGWRWTDSVDAPLGEERERYRLEVRRADVPVRVVELDSSAFNYTAAMRAADAGGARPLTLEVAQLGSWAASRAARITIADGGGSP